MMPRLLFATVAAAVVSQSFAAAPNLALWRTNWNLTESHGFEYIEPSRAVRFAANQSYINLSSPVGLVGLDWTNSVGEWFTKAGGANRTRCEAVSRENCRRLKAAGMVQRCCIYHNTELALSWLESQREVMDDPNKAGYFLQYTDGEGNKNGTIYAEDIVFGRQWFWDHTNPNASDAFVAGIVNSVDDTAIDCTFMDDQDGVPMEHPDVMGRIGMNASQLVALQHATTVSYKKLFAALGKKGKWIFEQFRVASFNAKTDNSTTTYCVNFMETYCEPGRQGDTMVLHADIEASSVNQTVAAFLITRPPVAFAAVKGPSMTWDPFTLEPGFPKGLCKKEGAGVYSREWTNGVARLDCYAWKSELPFPSLQSATSQDSAALII
jgi:hypothetical protein